MAKLHLLRTRRPAKPRGKPRRKGAAATALLPGSTTALAVPGFPSENGLVRRKKKDSIINKIDVCVVGGGRGGGAGWVEEKNSKHGEKTRLHHQRGLFQVLKLCPAIFHFSWNQTEIHLSINLEMLRNGLHSKVREKHVQSREHAN